MLHLLILFFGAVVVNNFVLVRFLGLCPFIGVSSRLSAATGMGLATTVVLVAAAGCCYGINVLILEPLGLSSLDLIADIVVIALMVQLLEIIIRLLSVSLYNSLGIYLPLITTNCIVLGLVLLNSSLNQNFAESLVYAAGAGCGFTLVLVLFAAIRERLAISAVPAPFRNTSIALITAGLMSLAFMGFSGFSVSGP
ncbi:MAG: electron transport complex subunit RsxA [Succinivibrio sp.]|nr:electron transport complex subunit RsxA [Succinivibrio sp.]